MDRRLFDQQLEKGNIPSVLLFEGEEEHLKQEALSRLKSRILPEGMEEMNMLLLSDPDTDQLIAAAETLPFLADRRLVIVRDHPALLGRCEADSRLLDYLPAVPASTVLLFFCTGKPDGRKKLYTVLKKMDAVVSFTALKGAELTGFVTEGFRKAGKECDERTAEYLVFTVGSDSGLLLEEIAKIASYAGDRPSVTAGDVSALATPSTECTVFQMVDAVVSGQKGRTLSLLNHLLLAGTDRVSILALLLRQFRLLQHVKIMQYEKRSRESIRSALGVQPFIADQFLRQASAYTGGQVRKAVALCLETEYAVKSGRLLQDSALEAVILKLLSLRDKE